MLGNVLKKMKIKKTIIIISIVFVSCKQNQNNKLLSEPNPIDESLKNRLEKIYLKDQGIRELTDEKISNERKSELLSKMKLTESDIEGDKIYTLMDHFDSINLLEVESIVKEYGYPSKSLVGEPANLAVFYVIQHSDKIDKYLPLIKKAGEDGEIKKTTVVMMEDRSLMDRGIEQIYGTQIRGMMNKKGEWIYFVWPIQNPDSVNIRRKKVGFKQTVQEYAKEFDLEYKAYTIAQIDEL